MFLQYVFKLSALCLIACLISSQQRSANTAEHPVLLDQSTVVVAPKEKKWRGVKWGATYCYERVRADGTNHYRYRHRFWHVSLITSPSQWATVLTVDSQPILTLLIQETKTIIYQKASSRNAIRSIMFMNYVMKKSTNLSYMSCWAGVFLRVLTKYIRQYARNTLWYVPYWDCPCNTECIRSAACAFPPASLSTHLSSAIGYEVIINISHVSHG